MKPEILRQWETAARDLWHENLELRSKYSNDLRAYLNLVRLRIETPQEWKDNPQLQKEFGGDFNLFLTYKRHEAAGDIQVTTTRTI